MRIIKEYPNRISQILADVGNHIIRGANISRLQAFKNVSATNVPIEYYGSLLGR